MTDKVSNQVITNDRSQQPITGKFVCSPSVQQKLQCFHQVSKSQIDQFQSNTIHIQYKDITTQQHLIQNVFYVNSLQSRDAYRRMYQRNELYFKPNTTLSIVTSQQSPSSNQSEVGQLFANNMIYVHNLQLLQQVLQVDSIQLVFSNFVCKDKHVAAQVQSLVQQSKAVFNTISIASATNTLSTYFKDHSQSVELLTHSGSPLEFLFECFESDAQLPLGAAVLLQQETNISVQNKLRAILKEYSNVFPHTLPFKTPPDRGINDVHKIKLLDDVNVPSRRLYKTSPAEAKIMQQQIRELLDCGFISPSTSAYGSPVLFVRKPDGSVRFCIDYRAVNALTQKDRYPLPTAAELMDQLAHARVFSSLDLRSGYWQLKVAEEDQEKTAFICRYGHFQWHVMPFGLCNAPSTFQRCMNKMFADVLDKYVLVYLDDILIYSNDESTHEAHLRDVLSRLQQNQFYCKIKKCAFFQSQVEFLGHTIDGSGVHINERKVSAVREWPVPNTVNEIQRFLGFTNFFRRFIRDYARISAPLTDLCKQDVPWQWASAQQDAFLTLKQAVSSAPVLHVIDTTLPDSLELYTDASLKAVGSVLYQRVHGKLCPIAFFSKKLNQAEQNYSATDREMLSIVLSLRHFRHYLQGEDFVVRTDHAPLQHFFSQPNLSPRQLRWNESLCEFQPGLRILHVSGKENTVADALSRRPDHFSASVVPQEPQLGALCAVEVESAPPATSQLAQTSVVISPTTQLQWQSAQEADSSLEGVRQAAIHERGPFMLEQGLLYRKPEGKFPKRIVVPTDKVQGVLTELHDQAGHFGYSKTLSLVQQRFWWSNMRKNIAEYVSACPICQKQKPSNQKPGGLLQPLPPPERPWQHITMDLITDLPPTSTGFCNVLTVVDRLSKMAHFIPLTDDTTAPSLASQFVQHIVKFHGFPESIITDRDPRFIGQFWKSVMSAYGTQLKFSTAFHPQTDGQSERANRTIEQLIRCYTHTEQQWSDVLHLCEMYYNNAPSRSTGKSPYELTFGFKPRLPIDTALDLGQVPAAQEYVQTLRSSWQEAAQAISRAQLEQKKQADRHRMPKEFGVGDWALLSTQNLQLPAYTRKKFKPRYIGPFQVTQALGVSYRLQLPASMRIHDIFHASLLKHWKGPPPDKEIPDIVQGEAEYEVEKVLKKRVVKGQQQYLVRWKQWGPEEDSWEPIRNLENAREAVLQFEKEQNEN